MKRTYRAKPEQEKEYPKRLPDAIYNSLDDNFTAMKNSIIRDEDLSLKAKGLLILLLSNKSGEWTSYVETIKKFTKDGAKGIGTGLRELEEHGYLARINYVDKKGRIRGSFWAYTDIPYVFDIEDQLQYLKSNGLQIQKGQEIEKGNSQKGNMEKGVSDNRRLKILNNKNINNNNNNMVSGKTPDTFDSDSNDFDGETSSTSSTKPSISERNETYLPHAKTLAEIVQSSKNVMIPHPKLQSWANEIRKLIETDGIDPSRIEKALDWYKGKVGEAYIPVIESGASLRDKFIRLEEAMKRAGAYSNPAKAGTEKSPKVQIKEHFDSKDLAHAFLKNCYIPARKLFEAEEGELANQLLALYTQIESKHRELSPELRRTLNAGPIYLIEEYIYWIKESDWITNMSLNSLDIGSHLFKRFRREIAKNDNMERDPLTGNSYMRG